MPGSLEVGQDVNRRSAKGMTGSGIPSLQCTIGGTGVYSLADQRGFLFRSKMAVDADGAPNAYHPSNGKLALDYLGNAGKPGNWWGVVTDTGEGDGSPVVQGSSDPCPGFYCLAPAEI